MILAALVAELIRFIGETVLFYGDLVMVLGGMLLVMALVREGETVLLGGDAGLTPTFLTRGDEVAKRLPVGLLLLDFVDFFLAGDFLRDTVTVLMAAR